MPWLRLLAAAILTLPLHAATAQEEDLTPPTLAGLSISPVQVDASAGPVSVMLAADAADDLAGVGDIIVLFRSPDAGQIASGYARQLVAGTLTQGTFRGSVVIPLFADNGIWKLSTVELRDRAGNRRQLSAAELAALDVQFEVVSPEDLSAPALGDLSVSPSAVDALGGPASVTVTANASDDLAGVDSVTTLFRSPDAGQIRSATLNRLVAGTPTQGTFQSTLTVPQFADNGIWKPIVVELRDKAGNRRQLPATELAALNVQFEVVSPEDLTAPLLGDLRVSPRIVDASSGPAAVTLTANVSDDLAGVDSVAALFRSPDANQVRSATLNQLVAGSSAAGTLQATLHVPQYSDNGVWHPMTIELRDKAGNRRLLSAAELDTLDATFEVFGSAPPDTTPDPFSFVDLSGVAPGSRQLSNSITLSGLDAGTTGVGASISGDDSCRLITSRGALAPGETLQLNNGDSAYFEAISATAAGASVECRLDVADVSDTWSVTTEDNHAPHCALASPSIAALWPPNHALRTVEILRVSDPDGDDVDIAITHVTQDEPVNGAGDGNSTADAVLSEGTLMLRAERSGTGNGRVYSVHFSASDARGARCSGRVSVCVPRSQRAACGDDGQHYESTAD